MADLVALRFIERMAPYMPNAVAGFEPDHARRIVAAGRAVYMFPPDGCDEYGNPIKKEAEASKPKPKPAPKPKKEPKEGLKSRKSGKLGTVKK